MGTVFIVTLSQLEGRKIADVLDMADLGQRHPTYEIIRPAQLMERLDQSVDLLIYNNHNNLSISFQQDIQAWRKKGFLGSVILMSRVMDSGLFDQFETLNNFVLVEKPYADKDLRGISEKMFRASQVAQRKFRRFTTNQDVAMVSYKTEFKSVTKVNNISLGGLCVEGHRGDLAVGDLLKINFSFEKLNVERVMNGRVIWVQNGAKPSAGIQFLKEEEVYGQLLRDIG